MLKQEKIILSVLFQRPKTIDDFNINYLYSEDAKLIYATLERKYLENKIKSSISHSLAMMWYEDPKIQVLVKNIFEVNISIFSYNIEMIMDLIQELESEKKRVTDIDNLKLVIKELEKGNIDKADSLYTSIKIKPIDKTQRTSNVIKNSISNVELFQSGLNTLDKYTGSLRTRSMMSIAGQPGTMKTYFSIFYILNMLKANKDYVSVYFQKEMPEQDMALRIVSYFINKDIQYINKYLYDRKSDELFKIYQDIIKDDKEKQSIIDRFIIIPDNKFNNVSDMEKIVKSEGAKIWCLDYIQQMASSSDINSEMNTISTEAKAMTNGNNCFGIILSQVNDKEVNRRSNKIPLDTDMQYGTRINQNSAQQISLFYPQKIYKGVQPMTTNKYKSEWFYVITNKTRDSPMIDNFVPLKIDLENGFFNEVTDVKEYKAMENWMSGYVQQGQNSKKSYY